MLTEAQQAWMIGSARIAALLYVVGATLFFTRRRDLARIVLTFGLAAYLLHVWCAFEYVYRWSHSFASSETDRQIRELFGRSFVGGIWLNYLFTALWSVDCFVSWRQFGKWTIRRTSVWLLHAFLLFIVVNATVVVWTLRAW